MSTSVPILCFLLLVVCSCSLFFIMILLDCIVPCSWTCVCSQAICLSCVCGCFLFLFLLSRNVDVLQCLFFVCGSLFLILFFVLNCWLLFSWLASSVYSLFGVIVLVPFICSLSSSLWLMRYLIVDIVLILVLCSRCVLGFLFRSLLLCVFCVLLFCFLSLIFSFVLGLALPSCCLFFVLVCGVLCSLVLCSCFCCSILFLFLFWHLLFLFIRDLILCCLFVVLVVCVLISFVFYALLLFCSLLLFFGLHFWFLVFGFGIVLCFWRLLDVYSYCCSVALCVKCSMFLFFCIPMFIIC